MTNNIEKFKESLLKTLIEKTENYEIEWKWFNELDKEDLEKKHAFAYSNRPQRVFPYNYESVLADFPDDYKIIAKESMCVTVKYFEWKKKDKKYREKKLRYGLIKGYNSKEENGESMLSLVCDKKNSKFYVPIITSNSSEKCQEDLEKLYYLADFKMYNEMKLIEKWMSGEFEKIENEIKSKKTKKKAEKKSEKEKKSGKKDRKRKTKC